jgi:hypothetical protein
MFKKIMIIFVVLLSIVLICLPFLLPLIGKVPHKAVVKGELLCRIKSLQKWKEMTEEFQVIHKNLPSNLYQVFRETPDLPSAKVGIIFYGSSERYFSDPNYFFEQVEYRFYSNEQGWLIIETSPGRYNINRFMIDNNNNLYEIKTLDK